MDSKHTHLISETLRKSIVEHQDFKKWSAAEIEQGLSISVATFLSSAAATTGGKVSTLWEHFKEVTDLALMVIECKNEIENN